MALKIAAGVGLGVIYKVYYDGDTFNYFEEAATIASFLQNNSTRFFDIYFNTTNVPELTDQIIFYKQPRALYFAKLVSFFYILTGGNYWIISLYLSFINFLGVNFLVNQLNRKFPDITTATYVSFYFLPTFVFWTSGLLKESLAIAALASATGIVMKLTRTKKHNRYFEWVILVSLLIILWKLKYFYAAIAIPLLTSLVIYEALHKHGKLRIIAAAFGVLFGALLMANLHYNLNINWVLKIIYENYKLGIATSSGGVIEYYNFDGSALGFLINIPLALLSGLFRPTVLESYNMFQYLVAFENLAISFILVVALWKSRLQISFSNPYIIIALIYIVSLATLLAFSTPNFGTLSRYKVAYYPFFVLLICILFFKIKKVRSYKNLTS